MSSHPHDDPTGAVPHPLVDLVDKLRPHLDRLTGSTARPVWGLSDPEKRHVLLELAAITNQLDSIRLAVLAEADRSGACEASGARTAADWVAIETHQRRPHARADLHLATQLETHRPLHDAVGAGGVNTDQARAILASLDLLPASGDLAVTPDQRLEAEEWLVGQAAHHDATALRLLGRHLLEVVCPDRAEEIEGRLLEAQEAAAARRTTFTMREDDQGTCHGRFRIPTRHGQMLTKMLQALIPPPTAPDAATAPDIDDQPMPVRLGVAFTDLVERIPATSLPTTGGVGATVVVTMTLDQLLARLDAAGVCTLDTGARVSAAEARRLAARAGVIPLVLGGASVPLDAGRTRRLYSAQQRIALQHRDQHCTAHGCTTPPALCHAHHDRPWSAGGPTDLTNGRLLCGHHHRRVHDPAYGHERHPDGTLRFHKRE